MTKAELMKVKKDKLVDLLLATQNTLTLTQEDNRKAGAKLLESIEVRNELRKDLQITEDAKLRMKEHIEYLHTVNGVVSTIRTKDKLFFRQLATELEKLMASMQAPVDERALTDGEERAFMLDKAKEYVCKDRNSSYGTPEDSFSTIANLWNAYWESKLPENKDGWVHTHVAVTAIDVALMLDLLKTARLIANPNHLDSWIDKAGYSACGYGIIQTTKQKETQHAPV